MSDIEPAGEATSLDDVAAALEALQKATDAARVDDQADGTGALVLTGDAQAPAVKGALAEMRRQALDQQAALNDAMAALRAQVDAQLEAARQRMAPLKEYVRRLEESIWTVNLYLGRDEQIVTLADGDPAPAGAPIVLRQMVLSMDQECMVAADDGGIDVRDIEEFDRWLTSDPAHLHQVLPEERGVVVLVPRRTGRDYRDPWLQKTMNDANNASYWLIRNGGKLYRMATDFQVGDRLVPARDEFTGFFTERRFNWDTRQDEFVQLEPGTPQWMRAEKEAGARQRHYMRVALILQGLIDRTVVFHPLPSPAVSLLSQASYDAGHVQMVTDAELAIGTGREPFYDWLRRLNRKLRPGMRVVGAFNAEEFRGMSYREGLRFGEHPRVTPPRASWPLTGELYEVTSGPDGRMRFLYDRTDTVYRRWEAKEAERRASCTIQPDDRFIIPFDLVTPKECAEYIESRTERHTYVDMVPLLRSVIAAKATEEEAEEPFRRLLADRIAATYGLDLADAQAAVPALVDWWKLTNRRHRPLANPSDPEFEGKALAAIVTEYGARVASQEQAVREADAERAMVTRLRDAHPGVMVVARKRDGGYIALEPQPRTVPEPCGPLRVWVREHTTGATGRTIKTRDWVMPGTRPAGWRIIWATPVWESWDTDASPAEHMTDPDIHALAQQAVADSAERVATTGRGERRDPGDAFLVTFSRPRREFRVWRVTPDSLSVPELLLSERTEYDLTTVEYTAGTPGRGRTPALGGGAWPGRVRWDLHYRGVPWEPDQVVWTDEAVLAEVTRRGVLYDDARRRAGNLAEVAHAATRSVLDGWTERAERAAYDRFMDDYNDASRWEGHRKTLRIHEPPGHYDAAHKPIRVLVERGIPVEGLTIETAAQLAADLTGADKPIPEDLMGLTIAAPLTRRQR